MGVGLLLLFLRLRLCLVALVQTGHNLIGDVKLGICHQDVVSLFGQDIVEFLRLIEGLQECLDAVAQFLVQLGVFACQFVAQTLFQLGIVLLFLLYGSLCAFQLVTCGEAVALIFLLQGGGVCVTVTLPRKS